MNFLFPSTTINIRVGGYKKIDIRVNSSLFLRMFRFFPSIVTGALQALLGATRRAEEERQEEESL